MGKFKDSAKYLIGRVAEIAMPSLGKEIDAATNTARAPKLKRAILFARLQRATRLQNRNEAEKSVENALLAFWKGNSGDQFHGRHAEARIGLFLEIHSGIIDTLATQLAASGPQFTRLVEIGCGDGKVLTYCMSRLPEITRAVGLDINSTAIDLAMKDNASRPEILFEVAEATNWMKHNPLPGTILLSNGGVLEYFSPESFDNLLQAIGDHAPAAVVLIEPVDPGHDLATDTRSHVFGHENSFSHNHRFRLEQAGFDVTSQREIAHGKVRWMTMIAVRTA